ncbi:MAG TPA: HPF/RaiA family ribosome-associated protein [Sphingomicrobium sp.]|nr:HPF/RaiA family ribosome-associated protein [Sphingomicrobium sp.]
MQFLFNSDNQTPLGADAAERAEAIVASRLDRISDRLTRVEVHVSDVDGPRNGGDDMRCAIEIRPNGMRPITATDQAATVETAIGSAADKVLKAFDRQVGKTTTRKGH